MNSLYFTSVTAVVIGLALLVGCKTLPVSSHVCDPQKEREEYEKIKHVLPDHYVEADIVGDGIVPKKVINCIVTPQGQAMFEGDIVIAQVAPPTAGSGQKGLAITGRTYRWPNGVVPYAYSPSLPAQTRGWADAAMQEIRSQVGPAVTFVARTNENDYIEFVPGSTPNVGSSPVGRQRGRQKIELGSATGRGVAIHEICHSLGLWHEQSRSDRDHHVCILWENMDPKMRYNFDQHVRDGTNLGSYDLKSRMHYHETAFSVNGKPTILAKDGTRLGRPDGLSSGDVAALRAVLAGD